jgi:hypothetical protein
MIDGPRRHEIDHRTIKLLVGVVALAIAPLTSAFSGWSIHSVSEAYYQTGWSQTTLIGFLFSISALLLAYNGYSMKEMILSKVAAIAGLGIALFPCQCICHPEVVPHVHGIFAAVMFLILAYFCHLFRERAKVKGYPEAVVRSAVHAICGITILAAIAALGYDNYMGNSISGVHHRFTFYGEATGLVAFGISWLTASRVFPGLANQRERYSPFRSVNPE